jgi:hypothetical protein
MPKKYNLIPKPGLDQHRWCLCGCGIEVKGWNYRLNQPHRWVSIIHYMKTVKLKHSKETLLKKSQAMRKVWERKRREGTNKLSEEAKEHIRQSQIGKHKGELNGCTVSAIIQKLLEKYLLHWSRFGLKGKESILVSLNSQVTLDNLSSDFKHIFSSLSDELQWNI